MEDPGLSLFQGPDLKFSNSFQRAEEEELAEENRKRNAELKDLFQDAFDDLNDSDASSLASSHISFSNGEQDFKTLKNYNVAPVHNGFHDLPVTHNPPQKENLEAIPEMLNESNNSILGQNHQRNVASRIETDVSGQHYKHCLKNGLKNDWESNFINNYKNSEGGSYTELMVLYEVRMREVEQLRREIAVEREAKEEALHQLSSIRSERNTALNEVSDLKELITKSKDRIGELEEEVEKMKSEILALEKARETDKEELQISYQQVAQLEQKIVAIERCDPATNSIKQMDAFVESLNSKHQKEINLLQHKIDSLNNRLEEKNVECQGLESKLNEVERKRAALVLEKCDGVARQESALQELLDKANEEKIKLNTVIVSLQAECTDLKTDLEQYESLARIRLSLNSSSDEIAEGGIARRGLPHMSRTRSASSVAKSVFNPHHQDLIDSLKDELQRALHGKKAKRHEINKLQEQVRSKELQIQKMKDLERDYLAQLDNLKGYITRIVDQERDNKGKIVAVEQMKIDLERLDRLNQEHLTTIEKLNKEIKQLQSENKSARDGLSEEVIGLREGELAQLKAQTDQLLKVKESEWRAKFDLVTKECYEIKQLYMDLRKNNAKLTDQLDLQKQHLTTITKEKDHIYDILKQKEMMIDKLKEENIKYKVEKEINQGYNYQGSSTQDKEMIRFLEQEVEVLRNELYELPKKQTKELEGLKSELEAAKVRLLELDNRLRDEFQNEISNIISERDRLKVIVEESNLKSNTSSYKPVKDVGVCTDFIVESDVNDLKQEIERLRDRLLKSSNEVNEKKLITELEDLEKRLISEHKAELLATEERIKSTTVAYYANHIDSIKKQFTLELEKIIANEENRVKELTELLAKKENEIQQLKNSDTSEKVTILIKRIEEDRNKLTSTLKQWSIQVEQLKKRIADDENKLYYLNQSLKTERKEAQKYKAKFDNARKRIQQEKLENLLKIKSDLENLKISNDLDGKKMEDKLKLVELEFNQREKILKQQLENKENQPEKC